MDTGDELRLREIQREYLDFLDDDVSRLALFPIDISDWNFNFKIGFLKI